MRELGYITKGTQIKLPYWRGSSSERAEWYYVRAVVSVSALSKHTRGHCMSNTGYA